MKTNIYVGCIAMLLTACAVEEGAVKQATDDTARGVSTGVENIIEGIKQLPGAIDEAVRNVNKNETNK